jgi:predicted metallopeptidase
MATETNKQKKWILILIISIFVISIPLWLIFKTPTPEYFDKIELSDKNFVVNRTETTYLDTIIKIGLEELGYTNIVVFTRPISIDGGIPNIELKAHIIASIVNGNSYLIEIDKDSRSGTIESISHELIHLNQMNSGNLKMGKDYVIWKKDTIRNIPEYADREWEQDAVGMGKILEERIRKKLYSK